MYSRRTGTGLRRPFGCEVEEQYIPMGYELLNLNFSRKVWSLYNGLSSRTLMSRSHCSKSSACTSAIPGGRLPLIWEILAIVLGIYRSFTKIYLRQLLPQAFRRECHLTLRCDVRGSSCCLFAVTSSTYSCRSRHR